MVRQKNDWSKIGNTDVNFAWLGHSSVLIAVDAMTVLVDPVLEELASPDLALAAPPSLLEDLASLVRSFLLLGKKLSALC